ncbi:MAG: hypothetical protein ACYTGV_02245 [Planctomycetota bacterium]
MTVEVHCECGEIFDAPDELKGGITNCPGCEKAVDVPGLSDPMWRLLQVGAALAWAGVTAVVFVQAGLAPAAIVAVVTALALWLLSRGL